MKKMRTKTRCLKPLLKNKKGGIEVIGVALTALVILIVMALFFIKMDPFQKRILQRADSFIDDANASLIITNAEARYSGTWDSAFLFLFGGFWFAALLVGYNTDNGVIWMILIFLLMVFILLAAGMLSNYWDRATDSGTVASSGDYPYTYFLMDNFMRVILLIVGSGVLVGVIKEN